MARSAGITIENNFTNGLVTEATGLNFPENAVVDTLNCIYRDTGKVSRRPGMNLEAGAVALYSTRTDQPIHTYLWENANNDGEISIAVIQIGNGLHFYRVSATQALSAGYVTSHFLDPVTGSYPSQFATGMGKLIVTNRKLQPLVFNYDGTTVNLEGGVVVQIRDFKYLDDGTAGGRPKTLPNNSFLYNLYNQGWQQGYIDEYKKQMGFYPSTLYDIQWTFLKPYTIPSDLGRNIDNQTIPLEIFSPKTTFTSVFMSKSEAPRGRQIYNAWNINRTGRIGKAGIPNVITSERPTCVAFYAGRVFYGGVMDYEYSNSIYYTQIIEGEGIEPYGQCYQKNDPTSQTLNELLATDGGQVRIPEMGIPVKFMVVGGDLMIFATNGIWAISGSTGVGFSATDFTIKRVSSVPCISPYSFIDAGGTPIWWNYDGIYTLQSNPSVGAVQVSSLVDKRIKKFFTDTIPTEAKKYARGAYNSITREVQWLYRSTSGDNTTSYQFDSILCLNLTTGSFYVHRIDQTLGPRIHGLFAVRGTVKEDNFEQVYTEAGEEITDNDGNLLETNRPTIESLSNTFKYLMSNGTDASAAFAFADMNDEDYVDWAYLGGADFTSYFISGYKVHGEAVKKFQSNFIQVYADTFDDNLPQFYVQGVWDYHQSASTVRWSNPQLLTYTNVLRDYDSKRIKIRGAGKALQLKFESFPGQPMEIVGWSMMETVNQIP